MDYGNYVTKLVQSFRNNHSTRYMFIKHYNTLVVSEEQLHDMVVDDVTESCVLFHEFPMHVMQGPFSPFLEWIRELYFKYFKGEQTPEEFVKNAGVYSMHRAIFSNYIQYGVAKRTEEMLLPELKYERHRMLKSMISVYQYVSERNPIIIFLEKLHLANDSCIRFLHALISERSISRIRIIGMYNELYRTQEHLNAMWKQFVTELDHRNLLYEWSSPNTEESTVDVQNSFIPKQNYLFWYLDNARNMSYFLCLEDALYYLGVILDKVNQEIIVMNEEESCCFYGAYARILLMSGEYTRALQMCENMGIEAKKSGSLRFLYRYNYLTALCQYGMDQLENKVEYYIDECKRIARELYDELLEYMAEEISVLSNFNYWREIFDKHKPFQISQRFVDDTKRYGCKNLLAHIYAYCYDNDKEVLRKIVSGEQEDTYFNLSIQLGTELDNKEFLLNAYTNRIIAISDFGYFDIMEELYHKKIALLEGENRMIRKVHNFNGLGFLAAVMERYQQANSYFNKSLMAAIQLRDCNEVAVTLYNSSVNKMLAREYGAAMEDLDMVLRIMDMLCIHSIVICDTSKIYGLLGYCALQTGDEYTCLMCLNRIEAYISHLDCVDDENKYESWYDTLFLYHLIRGVMCTKEECYKEAEEHFHLAEFHQDMAVGNRYFNYPIYVVELAKCYKAQKKDEERIALLEKGIEFCSNHGHHMRAKYMMDLIDKKNTKGKREYFEQREVNSEKLLEVISSIAAERSLESCKKDINFMTIWQDLMNRRLKKDQLLPQAITVMKNFFNLDGVALFVRTKRGARIQYFDAPASNKPDTYVTDTIRNFTSKETEALMNYFVDHKRAILTNRIDKGFMEYKELTKLLDIYHIITLYAYPLIGADGNVNSVLIGYVEMRNNFIGNRYLLQDHNLAVLNFFSNQLYVAIERIDYLELINRMNSQLSDMAVTDLLTGLYNRQGFEKKIQEDVEKEKEKDSENVIIYIDLDNFKYYNDTFGHEIGDFVLKRFAQILEKVVDTIGYAVRYGGDEFVLFIRNRDIEFAKKVAKNIFFKMKDTLYADIESRTGSAVEIPMEKKLSCSIGIASCIGYEKEIVLEALNKADKGLYYVKKSTKNNYVVWEEQFR